MALLCVCPGLALQLNVNSAFVGSLLSESLLQRQLSSSEASHSEIFEHDGQLQLCSASALSLLRLPWIHAAAGGWGCSVCLFHATTLDIALSTPAVRSFVPVA